MNWRDVVGRIRESETFEGTLYRGAQNTGTLVRSSPEEFEVGQIKWELPKRIKFIRGEKRWVYYDEDGEKPWKDAEKEGVPVFHLLDPRLYIGFGSEGEAEQTLTSDAAILRVSFATRPLFESMGLLSEFMDLCVELAGETHEVGFVWREKTWPL